MEYAIYLDDFNHSLKQVEDVLAKNKRISRLYFGEEFCDELIPSLFTVKKSFEYAVKRKLNYTYVSGYLTEGALKKQYAIFSYLNKQRTIGTGIEVVVNDWGVLKVISEEFGNLIPLLGRMMTKVQRMPRYTKKQPISFSHLVANPKLWDNQMSILSNSNLTVSEYRKFLKSQGIKRIELDMVPQGLKVDKNWGFKFSVYTPWSYVTGARTCDLAALTQPEKAQFITDKVCSKSCKRFFIKFETGNEMLPLMQRGNSIFFNNSTLASEFIQRIAVDRIILENLFFPI